MNPMMWIQMYMAVVGAYGEQAAGKAAEDEYKLQTKQIELDTLERERTRKERLNAAIATSMANTGASGVAMEGSPFAGLEEMERQTALGLEKDAFNARLNKMASRTKGKLARLKGDSAMGMTLAGSAVKAIDSNSEELDAWAATKKDSKKDSK